MVSSLVLVFLLIIYAGVSVLSDLIVAKGLVVLLTSTLIVVPGNSLGLIVVNLLIKRRGIDLIEFNCFLIICPLKTKRGSRARFLRLQKQEFLNFKKQAF